MQPVPRTHGSFARRCWMACTRPGLGDPRFISSGSWRQSLFRLLPDEWIGLGEGSHLTPWNPVPPLRDWRLMSAPTLITPRQVFFDPCEPVIVGIPPPWIRWERGEDGIIPDDGP